MLVLSLPPPYIQSTFGPYIKVPPHTLCIFFIFYLRKLSLSGRTYPIFFNWEIVTPPTTPNRTAVVFPDIYTSLCACIISTFYPVTYLMHTYFPNGTKFLKSRSVSSALYKIRTSHKIWRIVGLQQKLLKSWFGSKPLAIDIYCSESNIFHLGKGNFRRRYYLGFFLTCR